MADLIDRWALLKELATHFNKMIDGKTLYHPSMALAMRDVRAAPTVDAEPVKHGRWVNRTKNVKGLWDYRFDCSACDHVYWSAVVKKFNYCPNCGAKMDLEG